MSKLLPIVGGISGTVIIGGTGAYLISTQKAPTIKDTFKAAIIDFDTEKDLVNTKLAKLKALESLSESSRFKKAYDQEKAQKSGFEELKKTCNEIYESNSIKKDSDIFKDFQSYCARTNKDKLPAGEWAPEKAVWKTRYDKLKNHTLTAELTEIKSKNSAKGDELKDWCNKVGDLIFEGDTDPTYTNGKVFCGKDD